MTMNRRKFIGAGAGAVALVGTNPMVWAQSPGSIKIGAFGPMSGNAAAQGQSFFQQGQRLLILPLVHEQAGQVVHAVGHGDVPR